MGLKEFFQPPSKDILDKTVLDELKYTEEERKDGVAVVDHKLSYGSEELAKDYTLTQDVENNIPLSHNSHITETPSTWSTSYLSTTSNEEIIDGEDSLSTTNEEDVLKPHKLTTATVRTPSTTEDAKIREKSHSVESYLTSHSVERYLTPSAYKDIDEATLKDDEFFDIEILPGVEEDSDEEQSDDSDSDDDDFIYSISYFCAVMNDKLREDSLSSSCHEEEKCVVDDSIGPTSSCKTADQYGLKNEAEMDDDMSDLDEVAESVKSFYFGVDEHDEEYDNAEHSDCTILAGIQTDDTPETVFDTGQKNHSSTITNSTDITDMACERATGSNITPGVAVPRNSIKKDTSVHPSLLRKEITVLYASFVEESIADHNEPERKPNCDDAILCTDKPIGIVELRSRNICREYFLMHL